MGIWHRDNRMDWHEIEDEMVRKNADCVAAVCLKDTLIGGEDFSMIRIKNFGKAFNLCEFEPFQHQPIFVGRIGTGFLVDEDVVVTAGHVANENNVTRLRIVFGYKMVCPSKVVTKVPNENIYSGVKIIQRVKSWKKYGIDWALVQLDRKVKNRQPLKLSKNDISSGQPVYVMGYPCGLPLKYSHGATVQDVNVSYFGADLDVYSNSSGSPVFTSDTHEVIGMVVYGDHHDFRYTGKNWLSIVYPDSKKYSKGATCTRVSEFIDFIEK